MAAWLDAEMRARSRPARPRGGSATGKTDLCDDSSRDVALCRGVARVFGNLLFDGETEKVGCSHKFAFFCPAARGVSHLRACTRVPSARPAAGAAG
jgi:hypothetical protein